MTLNQVFLLIMLFLVFLGTIFIIVANSLIKNIRRKQKACTIKTIAKVVDVKKVDGREIDNDKFTYMWVPIIEYDVNGQKYRNFANYGASKPKYDLNQNIEICYNPNDCNEFYICDDNTGNMLSKIFKWVGIGLVSVSVIIGIVILVLT